MPTAGETWYATAKWQILQREDFKYQFAEGTLTRYVVFDDRRDLESKVNYVKSLADTSALVADGNTISGTWRTVSAGASPVNKDEPLGPIMLWHALVPAALTSSDGPYVTENNCTYKVSLTYYWRQAALPANVTAGGSGITYGVTDRIRDPKTGLWSYAIEKREQITTYIAEHKIAESQFSTTYSQTIRGVRTGDTDDTGAAITALWTVGVTTQGTSVTESRTKNDNCTQDITQTKIVAKSATSEREYTQTIFGQRKTITLRNQTTSVAGYVTVNNGIVTIQSSKLNDDGTFDNSETIITGLSANATAEYSQSMFLQTVTLTVRNAATPVAAFVAVDNGVITTQSWVRNDDGTYNNTQTLSTAIAQSDVTVERFETAFEVGVTITALNQASPVNALVEVTGGVITRRSSKLNDHGRYDNTESLSTARAVSDVIVERYETAFEIGVSITNLNQFAPVNALVEVSGGVITRRTSKMNDHGTYDNTETLTTKRADVQHAQTTTVEGLVTITDTDTQQVTTVPADETTQTPGTVRSIIKTTNEAGGTDVRERIEQGAKWLHTWTVTDAGGNYTVTEFANYTLAEIDALLGALNSAYRNYFRPNGPMNRWGKYDGRITSNPEDAGSAYAYTGGPYTEFRKRIVQRGNVIYKEVYTIVYYTGKGYGVSLGRGNYDAKNPNVEFGSEFQDLGRNWYEYKAVTAVTLESTNVTALYNAGSTITL